MGFIRERLYVIREEDTGMGSMDLKVWERKLTL